MTEDIAGSDQPDLVGDAERVLHLASDRGLISEDLAESTIAEVRERLAAAGLYDREESSIRVVIPDHILDDDTLARLVRELGIDDEDWLSGDRGYPSERDGAGRPRPAGGFDVFPVEGWDRYEFIEFIGRGGMGDVFKARDLRLGRNVALKFLRRDEPDLVARFIREAQVQAKVGHDNLCPVYDIGEVEGHSYIAMKYVAGGSIKEIADLLEIRDKTVIMVDVADAVQAAHQAGLIHRDIKPGNILVERNPDGTWHPYVVDFGIARDTENHDLTASGVVLGTPAFSSPEQVRGESSKLDRRTDIYGLGATLYWLLTGQAPFAGTYPEIISGVAEREPEPPHRLDKEIPVDLETIVLKCLEREPERRYSTAREVSEDLRRFLAGEPIEARRAGLVYRLGKQVRRHRGLVAAAVAVLVAFTVLGAFSLRANLLARRQSLIAQRLTEQAKEIEGLARVSAMMPLHDRSPERAAIHERMDRIETEMKRVGSIGAGPGHYALGRGYLTLQDDDRAREHLEKAVEEGYQSPGVSYALGLVLGRVYQRELWLARRIENEDLRSLRIEEIERELREPALAYLRTGSGTTTDAPAYAEALIAFYEGHLDEALIKTREAFSAEEWLYEAKSLEGEILLERGAERVLRGDSTEAVGDLDGAGKAFASAADIARSDPRIHEGECGRWILTLEIASRRGAPVQAAFDSAVDACSRALLIDPERADVHERLSHLYWRWADIVNDRGGDPEPFLDMSLASADRAIALDSERAAAYLTRGGALTVTALRTLARGEDPRTILADAIKSYEAGIAIDPSSVLAHDDLGYAWERLAMYEMSIGLDPRPSLDRAITRFREAIDLEPAYANAYNNSGIALWRRAVYEMRTGGNPEPSLGEAIAAFDKAISRNPDYAYAFANRGLAGRYHALYRLEGEGDPTPFLDRARSDLSHALELNPQIFWAYPEMVAVDILAARRAMRIGESPQARLRSAGRSANRALAANPQNAVAYQSAAEVRRWRAEWRLSTGMPVGPEIAEGRSLVKQALARNPGLASASITDAALLVIQAEAEPDSRARRALARDAADDLRRAFEENPLLKRENESLKSRVDALLDAGTN